MRRGALAEVSETPQAMRDGCAHCILCGFLVAAPEACLLHGEACPRYDLRQVEDVAFVVRALGEFGHELPLAPESLDYVLETAEMLYEAKQWSGHELLLRCQEGLG